MISTYSESSGVVTEAAEDDLERDSDMLDDASATDMLLESTDPESVSDGRDGDLLENASSTTSKNEPRTPEVIIKKVSYLN